MAELGYGRVLAGEDSDEEDEEELSFQFGGFNGQTRQSAPEQPKISVALPQQDDEEEKEDTPRDVSDVSTSLDSSNIACDSDKTDKLTPTTLLQHKSEREWTIDESMNGVAMMSHSIVHKLEPTINATIQRINELTVNQQRLLTLLTEQNKQVCQNPELEKIGIVMDKIPSYVQKINDMKLTMQEITFSVDRMKKRAESLRVDAQSHAIKKENKREAMSQWNKMFAASSSGNTAMTPSTLVQE